MYSLFMILFQDSIIMYEIKLLSCFYIYILIILSYFYKNNFNIEYTNRFILYIVTK